MRRGALVLAVLLLRVIPAVAQQSTSFNLEEHTINAGGHPAQGTFLVSASYRVTLDAIGDTVTGPGMSSASFKMESGFPSWFPPPGEVHDLRFSGGQTLEWSPERSVGSYVLYGGVVDSLIVADYGMCLEEDIDVESTIVSDGVPSGQALFYLVTAMNRLGEEGTSGFRSSGAERPDGTPCP